MTVNVALSDGSAHGGGTLLAVYDGALRAVSRREGEATVHPSNVLHAVSRLTAGVRYSLIMFFHRRRLCPPMPSAEDVSSEDADSAAPTRDGTPT